MNEQTDTGATRLTLDVGAVQPDYSVLTFSDGDSTFFRNVFISEHMGPFLQNDIIRLSECLSWMFLRISFESDASKTKYSFISTMCTKMTTSGVEHPFI
jgi:GTP-dependent phosphoenolpyruvate carboxykinase